MLDTVGLDPSARRMGGSTLGLDSGRMQSALGGSTSRVEGAVTPSKRRLFDYEEEDMELHLTSTPSRTDR